jgi:hypothetical protein
MPQYIDNFAYRHSNNSQNILGPFNQLILHMILGAFTSKSF